MILRSGRDVTRDRDSPPIQDMFGASKLFLFVLLKSFLEQTNMKSSSPSILVKLMRLTYLTISFQSTSRTTSS